MRYNTYVYMTKQTKKSFPIAKITYIAVVIALLGFGGFFFFKYQDVNNKYAELTQSQDDRNKEIVAKISKLYTLPSYEEEQPTIYFIKDKAQLGDSEYTKKFYDTAANEDVVVAYQKADISIIFRPSENKIVKKDNYANFLAASNPIYVAIIGPSSAYEKVENQLKSQYKNVVVSSKTEPKSTLTTGGIVDVKGNAADGAKALASLLGYNVGPLPTGETVPDNVQLVILIPNGTAQ